MNTYRAALAIAFAGVIVCTLTAHAHHALEYLEIESTTTPRAGEQLVYLRYDHYVDDRDRPDLDHWELTYGYTRGLTDRLMLDIHAHFAGFRPGHVIEERRAEFEPHGPSPFVEAVALTLQYQILRCPLEVAAAGRWEFPMDRAKELLGAEEPIYDLTLIMGHTFENHANVTANLAYEVEGEDDHVTWALGAKTPISADPHGVAAGIEFLGDFKGNGWKIVPGVYAPLTSATQLKAGLGFGREKDQEGRRLHTAQATVMLMVQF